MLGTVGADMRFLAAGMAFSLHQRRTLKGRPKVPRICTAAESKSSGRKSADARFCRHQRIAGAVECLVVGIMLRPEGAKGISA